MTVELLHHTPLVVCSTAIRTCWDSHDKSDSDYIDLCPKCGSEKINEYTSCYAGTWGCRDCGYDCFTDPIEKIKIGPKDKDLIDRVGNKFKHSSTLEHLVYTFYIQGISRALLQELARHRIASLSVKSTRYTLKELKKENAFIWVATNQEKEHLEIETVVDDFGVEYCLSNDVHERAEKYLVITDNIKVSLATLKALEQLRLLLNQGISNDKAKYALPEAYKTELTWTINARSLQNFLSLRSDKAALWEIRELAHKVFEALPEDHRYLFVDYLKEKVEQKDHPPVENQDDTNN